MWSQYREKYRDSIVQIRATYANHNIFRPYKTHEKGSGRGTGFIIDISLGIVATNAHVVSNAISITCRIPKTGQQDLKMYFIAICPEKDLAILQFSQGDLIQITSDRKDIGEDESKLTKNNLISYNMPFGDSLKVKSPDEVLTAGYPFGEEGVKFTTGNVSGFFANLDSDNDDDSSDSEESPSYIQITAPVNQGNSGGPLLNTNGEVIGIISAGNLLAQNVAYAVPSRTICAVLREMMKIVPKPRSNQISSLIPLGGANGFPKIIHIPRTSFNWCRTNQALIQSLTPNTSKISGIYVTKVFPDSCIPGLEVGDIITGITANLLSDETKSAFEGKYGRGEFDNYGDLKFTLLSENKTSHSNVIVTLDRKLKLKEYLDLVPIGSEIWLSIWRKNQLCQIKCAFADSNKLSKYSILPHYEPVDWEIFSGMCIVPLNLSHANSEEKLLKYVSDKRRYRDYLFVSDIFPGTSCERTGSVHLLEIIKTVNGNKVTSLSQLRDIIDKTPISSNYTITTMNGNIYTIDVKSSKEEDVEIINSFGINQRLNSQPKQKITPLSPSTPLTSSVPLTSSIPSTPIIPLSPSTSLTSLDIEETRERVSSPNKAILTLDFVQVNRSGKSLIYEDLIYR